MEHLIKLLTVERGRMKSSKERRLDWSLLGFPAGCLLTLCRSPKGRMPAQAVTSAENVAQIGRQLKRAKYDVPCTSRCLQWWERRGNFSPPSTTVLTIRGCADDWGPTVVVGRGCSCAVAAGSLSLSHPWRESARSLLSIKLYSLFLFLSLSRSRLVTNSPLTSRSFSSSSRSSKRVLRLFNSLRSSNVFP